MRKRSLGKKSFNAYPYNYTSTGKVLPHNNLFTGHFAYELSFP